jgi:hypothetical protein
VSKISKTGLWAFCIPQRYFYNCEYKVNRVPNLFIYFTYLIKLLKILICHKITKYNMVVITVNCLQDCTNDGIILLRNIHYLNIDRTSINPIHSPYNNCMSACITYQLYGNKKEFSSASNGTLNYIFHHRIGQNKKVRMWFEFWGN